MYKVRVMTNVRINVVSLLLICRFKIVVPIVVQHKFRCLKMIDVYQMYKIIVYLMYGNLFLSYIWKSLSIFLHMKIDVYIFTYDDRCPFLNSLSILESMSNNNHYGLWESLCIQIINSMINTKEYTKSMSIYIPYTWH
jgi:hypothetical protein